MYINRMVGVRGGQRALAVLSYQTIAQKVSLLFHVLTQNTIKKHYLNGIHNLKEHILL